MSLRLAQCDRHGELVERFGELPRVLKENCQSTAMLPKENASTAILRRNGFQLAGETSDEEIGLAWAWVLRPG